MRHRTLLNQLGSDEVLAAKLGVHFTTIWRWRNAGIPPHRWLEVVRLARRNGIVVDVDQLARARRSVSEVA
jgi:hypothetical protein